MKKILILTAIFSTAFTCFSQESIDDLKKDVITVTSDKWTITKYQYVTLTSGENKQLQFTAETTKDGYISRDYFIAIASEYLAIYSEKLEIDEETDLSELVGEADISIKIHMSKAGIQIILINDGAETKETHLWKDYFTN